MSLDPRDLKKGDVVGFGAGVIEEVAADADTILGCVWLSSGTRIMIDDELWAIAEVVKPSRLRSLHSAVRNRDGSYGIKDRRNCTAKELLFLLREDVATLKAAGVEGEGE